MHWAGIQAGRAPGSRGRCGGSCAGPSGAWQSRLLPRLPEELPRARGGRIMDRNPSPPPPSRDEDEEAAAGGDCIGSTVYSKHWLFGVLSGLIQVQKRAPRVGSPYSPQATVPPRAAPPLPREANVPSTTSPQASAAGPHPWPPGCLLADPKTAGRHSLCPSIQRGSVMAEMLECFWLECFIFTKFPNICDHVNALLTCNACDAVGFCSHCRCRF